MESGARNIIFIVKKLRKLAKYVKKGIFFKNINTCQQYKTQSFIVIFIQKNVQFDDAGHARTIPGASLLPIRVQGLNRVSSGP